MTFLPIFCQIFMVISPGKLNGSKAFSCHLVVSIIAEYHEELFSSLTLGQGQKFKRCYGVVHKTRTSMDLYRFEICPFLMKYGSIES